MSDEFVKDSLTDFLPILYSILDLFSRARIILIQRLQNFSQEFK